MQCTWSVCHIGKKIGLYKGDSECIKLRKKSWWKNHLAMTWFPILKERAFIWSVRLLKHSICEDRQMSSLTTLEAVAEHSYQTCLIHDTSMPLHKHICVPLLYPYDYSCRIFTSHGSDCRVSEIYDFLSVIFFMSLIHTFYLASDYEIIVIRLII